MILPLFPLSSVLFPFGRMPLQIFEQRYLDLVKNCLKTDSGFGVITILDGLEADFAEPSELELSVVGCYARIVDWDQLPNGLLGIIIEGHKRFKLKNFWREENGLVRGEINL